MLQEIFDIRSEPKYKQKKISKNHYKITPYNYENNYSMKYSPNYSIELEEGIINFAKSISN